MQFARASGGAWRGGVVVGAIVAALFADPAAAAPTWRLCKASIQFQDQAERAGFSVTLACAPGLSEKDANTFYLLSGERLLIGLTATARQQVSGEWVGDVYFPLQDLVLGANEAEKTFGFEIDARDLVGKTHVIIGFWHQSYLRNCADGRFGCRLYGYALAAPTERAEVCKSVKLEGYDPNAGKYDICRGGRQTVVRFR